MRNEDVLFQRDSEEFESDTAPAAVTEKYLLFFSDGLLFGVSAAAVVEIITGHAVTRLPLVPAYLSGVINLRGQIIPIVDIRRMLDRGECPGDCVIILQVDDAPIGIRVDQVQKMVDIDPAAILPVPPRSSRELVCGMYSLEDGQTMMVFDCARLLEHP